MAKNATTPPPHPPSPPNFSQPSMEDLSQTQSVPDILISRGRAWHGLTLDWHGQRCMCVPVEKVLQLSSGFMLFFNNCVKYTTFWTTFCELYRFIPGNARLRHKRAAAIEGSTAGGGVGTSPEDWCSAPLDAESDPVCGTTTSTLNPCRLPLLRLLGALMETSFTTADHGCCAI